MVPCAAICPVVGHGDQGAGRPLLRSFVAERAATPLPGCGREVGIDLGLASLAVTSDGDVIANPRFLRARERALAARSVPVRRRKGSANRVRAGTGSRCCTARCGDRLDHAHKIAFRLVRDNQAVYAEDLCVSGLARTRLARSVHDAGWSQLLRLMAEKAAQYGARSPGSAGSSPPARCARRAG